MRIPKDKITTTQNVSVSLDTGDEGLRKFLRGAVGAPAHADVFVNEYEITVSWDREKAIVSV